MNASTYRTRIEKLSGLLADEGIDAFFATSPITMGYFRGYHEGGGERFLTMAVSPAGMVRLICPALSESQARRVGFDDIA
ncbi:MAG TPA: aminopeptidase P family N-terminal domain-containing protein, partial [Fimbriimonadaceae bacterium]|nr:aminopeptidase P family N-terminal domain-containing protein [Fimbriimonadaceae bacterium]